MTRDEFEDWINDYGTIGSNPDSKRLILAEYDRLTAENQRLRKGLEFYALRDNYVWGAPTEEGSRDWDLGKIARAALKEAE